MEHDHHDLMVLGCVWRPVSGIKAFKDDIRNLKLKHGLAQDFEIKWVKVSPAKLSFYMDLLDYFFDNDSLHFRAVVAANKSQLNHEGYRQTHDDWYYKMYFQLIQAVLSRNRSYRIYLDYKDRYSGRKIKKLHDVLCNKNYDFAKEMIQNVQVVSSSEVQLIQLADFLIGIVGYANRNIATSSAKLALVERMRERSGYKLTLTTYMSEQKVNIFRWTPSWGGEII
jgi:hypothetical protein